MTNSEQDSNKRLLSDLFNELNIVHSEICCKPSSNNTYTSYTYDVLINSKETYDNLYASLSKIPQVKMAI